LSALPMRDAWRVLALIHLVSVFFERPTSLEAARTPMYPGRERSSSIAVIGGNTERMGLIRNIHRNISGGYGLFFGVGFKLSLYRMRQYHGLNGAEKNLQRTRSGIPLTTVRLDQ
jgi:hypothetical protein